MRRHAVILAATLAWLISIEGAEARLDILVDKATQRMLVMQNGYMRYIWPVSTGRDEMATPSGVYTPQRMERNWSSSAYYNSPMPYSIFFHNGYAIHGSNAINQLGGPASHGCVRLHPHHAALLFDLVQQEGPDKTTIEVTDQGRADEPSPPGREIAAAPGPYPPPPRIIRYRETGDTPDLSLAQRGNQSIAAKPAFRPRLAPVARRPMPANVVAEAPMPRPGAASAAPIEVTDQGRADEPSLSGREMVAASGPYPPPPRIIRYRETGDTPELSLAQRGNRSIAAKPAFRPRLAVARRPMPANVVAEAPMPKPAAAPPPPVVVAEAPKPAPVVRPPVPVVVAEGPSPERAHPPSAYGFKVLPASCWTGGASRWRWWNPNQTAPCK